jgi:hypothetical protein
MNTTTTKTANDNIATYIDLRAIAAKMHLLATKGIIILGSK